MAKWSWWPWSRKPEPRFRIIERWYASSTFAYYAVERNGGVMWHRRGIYPTLAAAEAYVETCLRNSPPKVVRTYD